MTHNGIFKLSLYITLANYPNIDTTLMLGQLFKLFALLIKGARRKVLSAFFGTEITPVLYLYVWFFILRVILKMFIRRKKRKS